MLSKNNLIVNLFVINSISKIWKKNYNGQINPKEGSSCIYISVILIASVYVKDKNCDRQVVLEKYKHVVRENKPSNFNTDDIEIYYDDENPDDSDEKIQTKKIKYINYIKYINEAL